MTVRALLLALLLGTAACSGNVQESAFDRGVAALDKGQHKVARIEFLNAIKADPGNGAIRLMQARTYLKLGDGVAAEAEVRRALQSGVKPEDAHHLLAHASLLQGQNARAAEQAALAPLRYAGHAARVRAYALLRQGEIEAAEQEFERGREAAPRDAELWHDIATYRRAAGDLAGALQAADKAVQFKPNYIEAITLRGELTRGQYGLAAAIPWFDRAIEIDSTNVTARLERAATLGDLGRMSEMLSETRKVLALSERNPMAFYLQAMLAARAREFGLARSLYARTRGALARQPAAMLLAGVLDYQAGNMEQATKRLGELVAMQPENRKARRLLAAAHWRRGDADATIAALLPLVERPDADNYSLALAGRAFAKKGDGATASFYLSRAAQPAGRSATALISHPVGPDELAQLRERADTSRNNAQPQVLLIGALLSSGLGDEALERARRLQARNPGAPDAHVLVGDALGIRGDFAGAANEYRKAANIAFTEPVAMRMIEALRRSGQAPAAASVLQLFLDQNPRNVSAMLLAATGFMEARDYPQAIRLYEALRQRLGDRDAAMLNNLAWAYSERGEYDRAIPLARKAWALDKSNPATTDTLGWILFKSGTDKAGGLALLERAARGAPTDTEIQRHLQTARRAGARS